MNPSARPKLRTHERQAGLVQAALQLAAEKSPAEITTGDLAQAVGITQGAVFKHFESKEAIWLAVLDWAHQALMARLQAVVTESGPQGAHREVLRAVFMAHIQFVQAYPGVPRLIFQELQHAKATSLKQRAQLLMRDYRQLVMDLLDAAVQAQTISAQLDTQAATVLFMGAVQGLVMQSLMAGSLQGMHLQAAAVFNIYANGLPLVPARTTRKKS
jgi:AcrR family transcriptional regulator